MSIGCNGCVYLEIGFEWVRNWRDDLDGFLANFRPAGRVKKLGKNGWFIGVLIQRIFGSFSEGVIGPENWVVMGKLIG